MDNYQLQTTTIWSFPDRGSWATHKGDYRGNWSPHIPRNLILKYTKEGDTVLDCFAGSGTTLVEAKLLNRNSIGIDINEQSVNLCNKRLDFDVDNQSTHIVNVDDARYLNTIENSSIDMICTHPPYADIIKYSNNSDDLSNLSYPLFIEQMAYVADECFRVLKDNHICAFMIGDIRKKGNVVPLGFLTMNVFVDTGFTLKEIIIKEQHNCKSTKYWKDKANDLNFYLLAHEYIFVLRK